MVLYEVNLSVNLEVATEYRRWFKEHVQHMLALEGFVSANVFERKGPEEGGTHSRLLITVQFGVESRELLEKYLREKATEMRQDGLTRFPNQFSATRRILYPVSQSSKAGGTPGYQSGRS